MAEEKQEFVTIHKGDKSWQIPKEWMQESDWDAKERQIARNKAEADILNGKVMSRQEIMDKFIDKSDYRYGEEYKKVQKENSDLLERRMKNEEERRAIEEQLKTESKPKPKAEWDDDDEWEALIGHRPKIYTEKGKQLKERYDKLWSEYQKIDSEWTKSNDKLEALKHRYSKQEKEWWDKNRPEYKKGKADKDYTGFATRTKSGYDHDLEQGIGFIAEMSPKEYLQRITYDVFDSTWSRVVSGVDIKNINKYMSMMKSGVKFDMPSIIEGKTQEGRHRAMAAYLLGIEKIPVYVRRK